MSSDTERRAQSDPVYLRLRGRAARADRAALLEVQRFHKERVRFVRGPETMAAGRGREDGGIQRLFSQGGAT